MDDYVLILAEIVNRAIIYSLFAIAFSFFYQSFGFFNLFIASLVSIGVLLLNTFINVNLNPLLAVTFVFLSVLIINGLIDSFIFVPFKKKSTPNFILMIIALGAYSVFIGLISIIWGNSPIKNDFLTLGNSIDFIPNTMHLSSLLIGVFLIIGYVIIINSKIGLWFSALQDNPILVQLYGFNIVLLLIIFSGLGVIYALSAGIIRSVDYSYVPLSSFNLYLTGGVALILGGLKNKYGFFVTSFIISFLQFFITRFIDTTWSEAIVYIILIIVLIFRPYGISGKKLKKVVI